MRTAPSVVGQRAQPTTQRSAPARGVQLSISGDCDYKQVSDSMALRAALADLARRLGVKCLSVSAMNLEHELVRLGAPKTVEMGIAGCAIFPEANVSIRVWPQARQIEMDMLFTETANAEAITLWANEALGAKDWACEVQKR